MFLSHNKSPEIFSVERSSDVAAILVLMEQLSANSQSGLHHVTLLLRFRAQGWATSHTHT